MAQVYCRRFCNPKYAQPCTVCGKLGDTGGKPRAGYICHPCRRMLKPRGERDCLHCGVTFNRRTPGGYCSIPCANRATNTRRTTRLPGSHLERNKREAIAPGLSWSQRRALLAKWKRQRRSCAYCSTLADTIDHVIPLCRGGTNWEGNPTPCCRRCNSSKAERLIAEWRRNRSGYVRCRGRTSVRNRSIEAFDLDSVAGRRTVATRVA